MTLPNAFHALRTSNGIVWLLVKVAVPVFGLLAERTKLKRNQHCAVATNIVRTYSHLVATFKQGVVTELGNPPSYFANFGVLRNRVRIRLCKHCG